MSGTASPITEADLVAYADGQLAPEHEAAVAAWLKAPEHAAQLERVRRWRSDATLLQAALDPAALEPVPARLTETITARRRRHYLAPVAAALLGIAVGLGGGWGLWGPAQPAALALADVGLSAHEVYVSEVRHPVEVAAADAGHLVNWLSNRLDTAINPPDLSGEGLVLLGGRLVPMDGAPAAQLMYEDATGQRFTLFIARTDEPATTALRYATATEICAYYWLDGGVGYVFVGPADRPLVWRLSRAVYEQVS